MQTPIEILQLRKRDGRRRTYNDRGVTSIIQSPRVQLFRARDICERDRDLVIKEILRLVERNMALRLRHQVVRERIDDSRGDGPVRGGDAVDQAAISSAVTKSESGK